MKKKRVEAFRNIRYPVGRSVVPYIYTREMRTSRARLPKKLTFEPGDYVLKSSRRNIEIYGMVTVVYIYITDSACRSVH